MRQTVPIGSLLFLLIVPGLAWAAPGNFVPLIGIPGLETEALSFEVYLNTLYRLVIIGAIIICVARITFGGVQYILSDIVTDKTDAQRAIKQSLLGLLIVLGGVTILNTINPELTRIEVLRNAEKFRDTVRRPPAEVVFENGSVDRREVDQEFAFRSCTNSGGEFVVNTDTFDCVVPTTVASEEYRDLLSAQGLSEEEQARLTQMLADLPRTTSAVDSELLAIFDAENDNSFTNDHSAIRTRINELVTPEDSATVIAEIRQGNPDLEEAAILELATTRILREEALFIQRSGLSDVAENRREVCTAAGRSIFRTDVGGGDTVICL